MKFENALKQRNLEQSNLPVAKQKRIEELLLLQKKLKEAQDEKENVDEENLESYEEGLKEFEREMNEIDEQLAKFINKFDLDKYEKQKQSVALVRENRLKKIAEQKAKSENNSGEQPKQEAEPVQPKPEPEAQPVADALQHEPPVKENEQSITEQIREVENGIGSQMQQDAAHYEEEDVEAEEDDEYEEVNRYYRGRQQRHEEEFERLAVVKKKPKDYSLWIIGIGAFILTVGAVNFFKRK